MKNVLLLLITGLLLSSCATGFKKSAPKDINDLEDDFAWLDNKDFHKVFEVKYSEPKDRYPKEVTQDDDALSAETVARLPESKLETVTDTDDVISKVVGNCYKKEFERAKELIQDFRRKYKTNPSFWNQVATCYFLQGEKRKALIFYNKALSLKSDFGPAINNLGVLHQSDGNDQRALAAYEEASKVSSFSLTPNFNKAQLYLKYGFVSRAERIYSSLWRKNKRDAEVVHALAVIYLMQKNYSKSINAFKALDNKLKDNPKVALNYALALAMSGDKNGAIEALGNMEGMSASFSNYYGKVRSIIGRMK